MLTTLTTKPFALAIAAALVISATMLVAFTTPTTAETVAPVAANCAQCTCDPCACTSCDCVTCTPQTCPCEACACENCACASCGDKSACGDKTACGEKAACGQDSACDAEDRAVKAAKKAAACSSSSCAPVAPEISGCGGGVCPAQ